MQRGSVLQEKEKVGWTLEAKFLTFISLSRRTALPWQLNWVLPARARVVIPQHQPHPRVPRCFSLHKQSSHSKDSRLSKKY